MQLNIHEAGWIKRDERGALDGDAVSTVVVFIQRGTQKASHVLPKIREVGRKFQLESVEAAVFRDQGNERRSRNRDVLVFDIQWNLHRRNLEGQTLGARSNRRYGCD